MLQLPTKYDFAYETVRRWLDVNDVERSDQSVASRPIALLKRTSSEIKVGRTPRPLTTLAAVARRVILGKG